MIKTSLKELKIHVYTETQQRHHYHSTPLLLAAQPTRHKSLKETVEAQFLDVLILSKHTDLKLP